MLDIWASLGSWKTTLRYPWIRTSTLAIGDVWRMGGKTGGNGLKINMNTRIKTKSKSKNKKGTKAIRGRKPGYPVNLAYFGFRGTILTVTTVTTVTTITTLTTTQHDPGCSGVTLDNFRRLHSTFLPACTYRV